MTHIDWQSFPHIRDLILDAVLDSGEAGVISALRLTERSVRDYIDHRVVRHVVHYVESDVTVTKTGIIAFSPESLSALAPRARLLDLHCGPWPSRQPPESAPPYFPNITCVRLHRDGQRHLRRLIEAPQSPKESVSTVWNIGGIHLGNPVMPRPPRPKPSVPMAIFRQFPIEDWGNSIVFSPRRSVVVFPQDLACLARKHPINFMEYIDYEEPGSELVIVLWPELNCEPEAEEDGEQLPPARIWPYHFPFNQRVDDVLANFPGDGIKVTAYSYEKLLRDLTKCLGRMHVYPATVTVVGVAEGEDWTGFANVYANHCSDKSRPEGSGRLLRFLSLEEWREEISQEEWELVRDLPPCFKGSNGCPPVRDST